MPRSLERPGERLAEAVEGRDQWLIRIRAEELQHEAGKQEHFEHREEERDDARDGPNLGTWVRLDGDLARRGVRGGHGHALDPFHPVDAVAGGPLDDFGLAFDVVVVSCSHAWLPSRRRAKATI